MPKGKKTKEESKVKKSDSVKPTRALSAYIFYSQEMVRKLKEENGITHKEAMQKAGELWN